MYLIQTELWSPWYNQYTEVPGTNRTLVSMVQSVHCTISTLMHPVQIVHQRTWYNQTMEAHDKEHWCIWYNCYTVVLIQSEHAPGTKRTLMYKTKTDNTILWILGCSGCCDVLGTNQTLISSLWVFLSRLAVLLECALTRRTNIIPLSVLGGNGWMYLISSLSRTVGSLQSILNVLDVYYSAQHHTWHPHHCYWVMPQSFVDVPCNEMSFFFLFLLFSFFSLHWRNGQARFGKTHMKAHFNSASLFKSTHSTL